jgi:hypothetical protein
MMQEPISTEDLLQMEKFRTTVTKHDPLSQKLIQDLISRES